MEVSVQFECGNELEGGKTRVIHYPVFIGFDYARVVGKATPVPDGIEVKFLDGFNPPKSYNMTMATIEMRDRDEKFTGIKIVAFSLVSGG